MNVRVREGLGTGAIIQVNETTDGFGDLRSHEFHADPCLNRSPLAHP
jgi:hypothetical protein